MADETKRIIEVEARGAETLRDLQVMIDKTKESLSAMESQYGATAKETTEYQRALAVLKGQQAEYNAEMRVTVKENVSAKGSYNDLVNQLTRLKTAWKQAEPSTDEYKRLTDEINQTKLKLESMDHSIGNWQRNVGNYAGSIASVAGLFGKAGGAATGAVMGVKNLTMGFQALSATPVIAILGVVVTLLNKLGDAFKSSEEASNALAVAMAPLKAGGQALQLVFQGIAHAVADVAEWLGKVAERLGLFTDKMRENQSITREEIALRQKQREVTVENARLELEAARERNIAADKANHSVQERIAALRKAADAERGILNNELAIAQKQYEIAERKAALTENDAATNDDLAEKQANLYKVQADYESGMREITSQLSAAMLELGASTKAAADDTVTALAEVDAASLEQTDKGVQARIDARKREAAAIADINKAIAEDDKALTAEVDALWKEQWNAYEENRKKEEEATKQKAETQKAYAKAVNSVLGSVAAAMQSQIQQQVKNGEISEEEAERQFNAVKALQYAQTVINTFAGVTQALSDPSVPSYLLRAVNAASVLASGIASAVQISNTSMSTSGTIATPQTPANIVSAPVVQTQLPVTRNLTTAEDEIRLNESRKDTRVYILASDIEASRNDTRVTVQESTF